MIDFDKEFDLLSKYLDYRIDWMAIHFIFRNGIVIDVSQIPNWEVERIYKTFMEQGVMIVNSLENEPVYKTSCLTFSEWKIDQNFCEVYECPHKASYEEGGYYVCSKHHKALLYLLQNGHNYKSISPTKSDI